MKAVVAGASGGLSVENVPDPTPAPGQVVLRVSRCGICGTDLHLHERGLLPSGTVMGHEFCGEIVESGEGLVAGQRVAALPILSCGRCERCRSGLGAFCESQRILGLGDVAGAYAEYVVAAAHETVRLPDSVDDDRGALIEPLAVGLHAVNAGRLRRGDRCLVIGAGPIGLAIALWARHFGAGEVIVSEPAPARRALAEQLGATRVVDPGAEELPVALAKAAPGGPDVVFEAVGLPGLIEQAVAAVGFRGRVVVAGLCLEPEQISGLPAMQKEASLHYVMAYEKDDFQYTVDLLAQERIDPTPMISERVGLEGVGDAFAALQRADGPCKVMVDPGATAGGEPGAAA